MLDLVTPAQEAADALPVTRICRALSLGRATYYRWHAARPMPDQDIELRGHRQQMTLEMPAYGYRRITHELQRRGVAVNHKRVLRLMREDNLLCLRQWSFVRITDAAHALAVYPHLVPDLRVDGLDRL